MIREINTWTPLEHANLLKLHGGIFTRELGNSELPSLVSDWMPYGHAAEYFVTAQPSELVPFVGPDSKDLVDEDELTAV